MTTATARPSDAYKAAGTLLAPAMASRPSTALRQILRERGHGSIEELHQALGVSRSTLRNWQPGGTWSIPPDQVHRLATAYAARLDEPVTDPDTVGLTPDVERRVDELFDAFYDDNHRAAVTWLSRHKPHYFRCNNTCAHSKVA